LSLSKETELHTILLQGRGKRKGRGGKGGKGGGRGIVEPANLQGEADTLNFVKGEEVRGRGGEGRIGYWHLLYLLALLYPAEKEKRKKKKREGNHTTELPPYHRVSPNTDFGKRGEREKKKKKREKGRRTRGVDSRGLFCGAHKSTCEFRF